MRCRAPSWLVEEDYTVIKGAMMLKNYRIEIDVRVDNEDDAAIIDLAKSRYQSGSQAWTEENGNRVSVPGDEFIQDVESALLELIEAAFRAAVPIAEPSAFRCGPISDVAG